MYTELDGRPRTLPNLPCISTPPIAVSLWTENKFIFERPEKKMKGKIWGEFSIFTNIHSGKSIRRGKFGSSP
jgi:hypothetical protein